MESAVARPTMTFGGEDLCPDVAAKAAALMHSLVLKPSFCRWHQARRGGAAEFRALLNGFELNASDDELEDLTLAVAKGGLDIEPLTIWLRQRVVRAIECVGASPASVASTLEDRGASYRGARSRKVLVSDSRREKARDDGAGPPVRVSPWVADALRSR